jgi:hypothetical protein
MTALGFKHGALKIKGLKKKSTFSCDWMKLFSRKMPQTNLQPRACITQKRLFQQEVLRPRQAKKISMRQILKPEGCQKSQQARL